LHPQLEAAAEGDGGGSSSSGGSWGAAGGCWQWPKPYFCDSSGMLLVAGLAVLDSPLLSSPGEGLLHPKLQAAAEGGGSSSGSSSSGGSWGAAGGVLAVAKALLL
jgi:hypothetical protein